jgi:hypothetical protein
MYMCGRGCPQGQKTQREMGRRKREFWSFGGSVNEEGKEKKRPCAGPYNDTNLLLAVLVLLSSRASSPPS